MLGNRLAKCRILILPPDKWREKVYNLEAQEVCFLDPAWDARQLQECIGLLPQGCRLHFFGGAVPEDVLHPSLNLLRFFYRGWRENKEEKDLLRFLPGELAEPLLLERALAIFAEAGLAGLGTGPDGGSGRPDPDQGLAGARGPTGGLSEMVGGFFSPRN